MLTELLGGYTAYTTAPDIIAEAHADAVGFDEVIPSQTPVTFPISGTVSF